jgi:anti-sigma regulatory factor (Ser/Thr protein kinase)
MTGNLCHVLFVCAKLRFFALIFARTLFMKNLVGRSKNIISFDSMDHPLVVSHFLHTLFESTSKRGYSDIVIDCKEVERAFPNVIVPVAGIIDYYQENKGVSFTFEHLPQILETAHIIQPLAVKNNINLLETNPMNVIWRFGSDEEVNMLGNEFVKSVSQSIISEEGVIDAMMWCLSEVMDNVLQHAGKDYGFVMGQIHKTTKHISFCIYDNGQGIFNSLKTSRHAPKTPIEAIELSIQERITRDKAMGQGNGMWGLSEIVKNNSGRLSIASHSGLYFRSNGNVDLRNDLTYLSPEHGACSVDFQLNYDKKVSLAEALKGHKPVNYRTESFEDDSGTVVYRLADATTGIGTRKSGEKIRNDLINLYNDSKKGIAIDFDEVAVVSSSFADELVGKLVAHFGFFGFNQIVRLKNMNPTIQAVVERSVAQRMAESFT